MICTHLEEEGIFVILRTQKTFIRQIRLTPQCLPRLDICSTSFEKKLACEIAEYWRETFPHQEQVFPPCQENIMAPYFFFPLAPTLTLPRQFVHSWLPTPFSLPARPGPIFGLASCLSASSDMQVPAATVSKWQDLERETILIHTLPTSPPGPAVAIVCYITFITIRPLKPYLVF